MIFFYFCESCKREFSSVVEDSRYQKKSICPYCFKNDNVKFERKEGYVVEHSSEKRLAVITKGKRRPPGEELL